MLRKLNKKKEGEDDEAYFMRKFQEIKKKKTNDKSMHALIVQEDVAENEFGGVEVLSTDSEDEEVRKPTHGREFVVKSEGSEVAGRCLMVTVGVSHMRGYTTDDGCEEAKGEGRKMLYRKTSRRVDQVM